MDIAQRAGQQPVLHVVAEVIAATVHIRTRRIPHPTPRRGAAGAAEAARAAEAKSRAGREQVRQFFTHLLRCGRSPRCVKTLKGALPYLTSETYFFATHGKIGTGLLRSYTTSSSHAASQFGSAKRMFFWVQVCSAKSIRD